MGMWGMNQTKQNNYAIKQEQQYVNCRVVDAVQGGPAPDETPNLYNCPIAHASSSRLMAKCSFANHTQQRIV
jgi:hypothetical protein